MKVLHLKEHRKSEVNDESLKDFLGSGRQPIRNTLKIAFDHEASCLQADYFVGADWLVEGELAVSVAPKIHGLDFISMFIECFKCSESAAAINATRRDEKLYDIFFESPQINLESIDFDITPLLIVHFLKVTQSIVRKGLQRGYINVEQPLKGKVKGKIMVGKSIKAQLARHDMSVTQCSFTEYSLNCLSNRLLKKALLFSKSYFCNNNIAKHEFDGLINYCLASFEQVDAEISTKEIANIKVNHFYKEYKVAIELAEKILKRFGYSLQNTSDVMVKTPPFYINMPLLFEIYVLKMLKTGMSDSIKYQVSGGKDTEIDFVDCSQHMAIDTKYKSIYSIGYDIDDARQLSGYARDRKINLAAGVSEADLNTTNLQCLVIYPHAEGVDSINNYEAKKPIEALTNFYKLAVKLPIMV